MKSMQRPFRRLGLFLVGFAAVVAVQVRAADDASEARLRRDIFYLASDELEGRGVGTKGLDKAADYIAAEFQKAGLKPAGPDGSFFQPFTMTGRAELRGPNTLTLRGPQGQVVQLEAGRQFQPIGMSGAGKLTAPLVFVGYGATAKGIGYDDFKDVDVAGKIVVVLRQTPRADNRHTPFDGDRAFFHAGLASKLVNADMHKAAAVLFVSDRALAQGGDNLADFNATAWAGNPTALPAVHVRRAVVDAVLQASLGTGLVEIEEDIDRDLKPRSARLDGWTVALEVNVHRPTVAVRNVVGVAEGSGPLAKETVVVGAHYDHLGYGGQGSGSLNEKSNEIHHGADDNGSGTTVLLELARRFGQQPQREGRRIVFLAFTGEERGLHGSEFYCKNPLFPLNDTVAMVNLDMVGRLRQDPESKKDRLIVYGTGTDKNFGSLIDDLNRRFDFKLKKVTGVRDSMSSSDHESFSKRQIPVLFFFTDSHRDYHRPSDTAEKINVPGMRRIADLTQELLTYLAQIKERPQYVKVAPPAPPHGTGSVGRGGPRLGVMPDYSDDKDGLLLSGISANGPAAKAGLKEGDRIVELGGQPVKNVETYMVLMARLKRGEPVDVGLLRDGKKLTLKAVPE